MNKMLSSLDSWKKSLLDTTKRNKAINYKELKRGTIDIVYPRFKDFLNRFEKHTLQFVKVFDGVDRELSEETKNEYITSKKKSFLKKDRYYGEELEKIITNFKENSKDSKNVIFSSYSNALQINKLKHISNEARLFEEENALNVLFVGVGILEWFEDVNSNQLLRSPLFFIPASLKQESIKDLHKLTMQENDIIPNDSLIRYMRDSFKYDFEFEFDLEKSIFENYEMYKEYLEKTLTSSSIWQIKEEINLSIFKFNNINMVQDLEENESKIINHELIKIIVGDETELDTDSFSIATEQEVDQLKRPESFFQALDSDSSQSVAIHAAVSGKSFVLQGPPGTGKSQTITNIITELIARGKKVLFVAEKKAALDVVYSNLKKIKLHDYALTLHNSRLNKKDIIDELSVSLHKRQGYYQILDSEYENRIHNNYITSKMQLNDYGDRLTKERPPLNKSLYWLYGEFYKYEKSHELRFDIPKLEKIDVFELEKISLEINNLEELLKKYGYGIENSIWYNFKLDELSFLDIERIEGHLNDMLNINNEYYNYMVEVFKKLEIELSNYSIYQTYEILDLINKAKNLYEKEQEIENTYLIKDHDIKKDIDRYKKILKYKKEIIKLQEATSNYNTSILDLDLSRHYLIIKSKTSYLSRLFSKDYKKSKKEVLLYQTKRSSNYDEILIDLSHLIELKKIKSEMKKISTNLKIPEYIELSPENLSLVIEKLDNYYKYIETYEKLFSSGDSAKFLETFRNQFDINKGFEDIVKVQDRINDEIKSFEDEYYEGFTESLDSTIKELSETLEKLLKEIDSINDVIKYREIYQSFKNRGLDLFVDMVISKKYNEDILGMFMRRYYYILINTQLEEDEVLNKITPGEYDKIKSIYKEADEKLIDTSYLKIRKIINENAPDLRNFGSSNREVRILQRESGKKRKIMPIRKLFEEIPNLILNLKPCLMMSPLSVSSYLRTTDYKFDVVIFDEASQVLPENAIGALYRSEQFIIVGDNKQLPPTNFFKNSESEDEDELTDVGNFESILDIASTSLPEIYLTWHYRSKYEDLIAASNLEMYGNQLTTFPQSKKSTKREGLELEKVKGVYQDNINQEEVKRVIELIFEHFDTFGHDRSLGVVTFNKRQSELINDELNKIREKKPKYEEYFTRDNKREPFFVKNLENVQGDERDTIIISVTYGPDKYGKVHMRFGPINHEGGNRRLNVAITRSKYNLIIVSSLTHNDIDLSKTQSKGVRFFKNILKFAEFGFDDKVDMIDPNQLFDSPFEEEVYREIINLGYKVIPQVGSSGYKIDLGVLHPNNDNKFILGVECDGASYHSSKMARERDRLRQQVLESRGWSIYRIWSTDWFKDKRVEVDKLKKAIEEASIGTSGSLEINLKHEKNLRPIKTSRIVPKSENEFKDYPEYEDIINNIEKLGMTLNKIDYILESTVPIHINELKKIIPSIYQREKYTNRVEMFFLGDLQSYKLSAKYIFDGEFVLGVDQVIEYREVKDFKKSRDYINIHPKELEHGILTIIAAAKTIHIDDLQMILRDSSGYENTSQNMRDYTLEILTRLVENKKINKDTTGYITLVNG